MKHPYRTAESVEDKLAFERLLTTCFGFPADHAGTWVQRTGLANARLLGEGRSAPAGLAIFPMGQWFGGKSVSCAGIAAVGVAPEARGRGLGKQLMTSVLTELAERRTALSCLHPATLPLYHRTGYEIAGGRYEMRIGAAALKSDPSTLTLTPLESVNDESMRACHLEAARRSNGTLDRPPPLWLRVGEHRGETRDGYAARDADGRVHGYVWYARRSNGIGQLQDLVASDLCAVDREGALALAGFLQRHHSMVRDFVWYGGAHDAFRDALGEVGADTSLMRPWMTRIVDVERALTERGYSSAVSGRLELDVEDTLIERNHGRFMLTVEHGAARVERGGGGRVFVPITDLAPIFTSYATAETRAHFGRVRGSENDLALFSSMFAGPAPAMSDMF